MNGKLRLISVVSLGVVLLASGTGVTRSSFIDPGSSTGNAFQAWASTPWVQTTQGDFEAGVLNNVDTSSSPGDVKLAAISDTVTDTFSDETKTASKTNLVVTGGQVKLTTSGAVPGASRPNAAGDVTGISYQYPPSGAHWDKVDDATPDNWSTYVYTNSTSYQRDLYNIPDHGAGTEPISSATVYFNFANSIGTTAAIAYEGPNLDGFLKSVQIATNGQVTDTVTDTLEFDDADGYDLKITHVSGDIYAIAYEGNLGDGFLKTVEITDEGQITDTVIDTLEFDTLDGHDPDIIHVSGDIYAIAYEGVLGDGFLKTVEIATNGQITDTVIDTLEFDTTDGYTPNIIHVSGDVYAIAYEGKQGDGFLTTVEIATNGQITDTVIDTLWFDTLDGHTSDIIHVSGDIYAIAYEGVLGDGFLKTVEIATNGQITDTAIDTLEFDTLDCWTPDIIHVSGDVYTIAYKGESADGFLKTVEIATNGQITDTVIDTLEFDTTDGATPSITHVSGDVYAIAYEGVGGDGFLKTVEIATDGQVTDTLIDTLEFDTTDGHTPNILFIPRTPGNVYARAAIKTYDTIYTGSEESTDNDAFVTEAYQWTTNPNTGEAWTWAEIDALQVGVDLRTGDDYDNAACTQVYVVVDYTVYDSPGTLISTNLLSGETVSSIDSFGYNASAIPSGTGLKVQFSQDSTNWYDSAGTLGGWDTLSPGTHTIDLSGLGWSGANFYYKMEFTSDGIDTPVLDEISITHSPGYYTSGTIASEVLDTGVTGARWDALFWDETAETGVTDITFEVRAADTLAGGFPDASWIDVGETSPVTSGLPSGRYMQWQATLTTSDPSQTPTLHEVRVYYSDY